MSSRRGRASEGPTTAAGAAPRSSGQKAPPRRRQVRLLTFTLATFVVGAALVLGFDSLLPRVVGALILCGFIVAGVFLIADPRFLEADDD